MLVPYIEIRLLQRVHIQLAILCLVGAGIILWSILPRPERFVAPGPHLRPAEQPRLFAKLSALAGATGQPMPAEVYLVADVNAWVGQYAPRLSQAWRARGLPGRHEAQLPEAEASG